ncbi:UNVERIFIED_CONTAM: anaphase-promoting complex subunit Hcn1 [Siphonaria sp. JEL0065]|nr:anaphase-promoting complex subunit Hcn1 [Siphonaria sp. JEL0065]
MANHYPAEDLTHLIRDFITHFGDLESQLSHLQSQVSVFRPVAQKLILCLKESHLTVATDQRPNIKTHPSNDIIKVISDSSSVIDKSVEQEWVSKMNINEGSTRKSFLGPEMSAIMSSSINLTNNLVYEAARIDSRSNNNILGSQSRLSISSRRPSVGGTSLAVTSRNSSQKRTNRASLSAVPRRKSENSPSGLAKSIEPEADDKEAFTQLMNQSKLKSQRPSSAKDPSLNPEIQRKASAVPNNVRSKPPQSSSYNSDNADVESGIPPPPIRFSTTLQKMKEHDSPSYVATVATDEKPVHIDYNKIILSYLLNIGMDCTSKTSVWLDFGVSLFHMCELWTIPFIVGYDIDLPLSISCIVTIKNTLDLVKELFTIRHNHPSMLAIKDPTMEDWRDYYFKYNILIDVVTIFPFELLPIKGHEYLWTVRLLRMHKLPFMIHSSPIYSAMRDRLLFLFRIGHSVSLILPLTFILFLFLHLQACVIFLAGRYFNFSNDEIASLRDAPLFDQYVWSLFMSATNVFPLGYHPTNPKEQLITVAFVLCGAGLYACIVGAISSIAMGVDASGRLYKQKIDELKEYMHWKAVEPVTQQKVLDYYELKYRGKFFEEAEKRALLNEMNESLRMEIAIHNCRELISKVPFLRREQNDGRDDLFAGRITSALQACYYVPGDVIFVQGEYFIFSGAVLVNISGKGVAVMRDGAFFGEIALVANIPRTATVQAVESCILYKLTQDDFNDIVHVFDDIKRKVGIIYKERMERSRYEEETQKLKIAAELVLKVPFLRIEGDEKNSFLERLAGVMLPVTFNPEDAVCTQGEFGDDLYVIKTGVLDVCVDGVVAGWLRDGDHFCESSLLGNPIRSYSVKASTVTQCYKISLKPFLQMLDSFPDMMEKVAAASLSVK